MARQVGRSKKWVVWYAVLTIIFVVMTAYILRNAVLATTTAERLLDGLLAVLVVSGVPTTVRKLRAAVTEFRTSDN